MMTPHTREICILKEKNASRARERGKNDGEYENFGLQDTIPDHHMVPPWT
jgi:hypothetical protein